MYFILPTKLCIAQWHQFSHAQDWIAAADKDLYALKTDLTNSDLIETDSVKH